MRHLLEVFKLIVISLFTLGSVFHVVVAYHGALAQASVNPSVQIFQPRIPKGIPARLWRKLIPADNPVTAEKVALGEALYFDKRMSVDGTVSCATCHDPAAAFADTNPLAIGFKGGAGTRNAPTVLNAMFNERQFWDGRAKSLEEQIKEPLVNQVEMGMQSHDAVVAKVAAIPEYQRRFRRAFGKEGITIDTIAKAIATFERTQLSGNSPFDRFITGDRNAITEAQKRGWDLFRGKAQCITCHTFNESSPFFTDFKFHNTGIAMKDKNFDQMSRRAGQFNITAHKADQALNLLSHTQGVSELGRYLVTKQVADIGAYKTPTLRDIELTRPYMHNGSEKTLLDVVRFYNEGGGANLHLDERMRRLGLNDIEMNDLVEFMRSLTSDDVLRQTQTIKPQTRGH